MGVFKLKRKSDVAVKKEVVSSGGFGPWDSNAYVGKIEVAYFSQTDDGALTFNFHFKNAEGQLMKRTEYVTSNEKDGQSITSEVDGKQVYRAGFLLAESMCLLGGAGDLEEAMEGAEDKELKLYNFTLGAEALTAVQVVEDLAGVEIGLCIMRVIQDKKAKGADGKWETTGEVKEINRVVKAFDPDTQITAQETLDEIEEAIFVPKWIEAFEGKTQNFSKVKPGDAAASGAPSGDAKPTGEQKKKTMFGNKNKS